MSGDEKNSDRGLSAAERKELRGREAKQAVADHEAAEQAFHENRERLREERLAREATAGPMLYPAPELPDDTPIENVRFSTRIRKAVTAAGWKTVGEIREASDATLLGRILDRARSPLFARRWACRRPMGFDRRARAEGEIEITIRRLTSGADWAAGAA